ncbi:MAG: MFS transporter [Euryarchaeota archaeon]|nr:MFS transporter [Euryarchaeota archaeon]
MLNKKLFAIYLGSFIGPLNGNSILALIPFLKSSFNADVGQVLLSIPFFMFPFAFIQLFSGTISDIYDRRKTVFIGFLIYSLGSFLCGLSTSMQMFLLSRALLGAGFALVSPVMVAILGDITTKEDRGKAMGMLGASITAGIASGPLIAGFLAGIGWRYVFFAFGILAIAANLLFWESFRRHEFRGRGGMENVLPQIKYVFLEGGVFMLSLLGFLVFFSFISVVSFLSDALSLPPISLKEYEVGFILSSSGIAGIIFSIFGGALVDRVGRIKTGKIGFAITLLPLILFRFSNSFLEYLVLMFILGIGTAFIWASLLTISMEVLPKMRGTVSSVFNSSRFLGYAVSPIIFTPVYLKLGINAVYFSGAAISLIGMLVLSQKILKIR